MKTCTRCQNEKPTTEFNKGNGKDGLYCYCKACAKSSSKARYKTKKETSADAPATKVCLHCRVTLPGTNFRRQPLNRDGLDSRCNDCQKSYMLFREFGITLKQYNEMLAEQNGVCAICKRACPSGKMLAVDHCHKSGKVRKLLCFSCNASLGNVKDDVDVLYAMIEYLKEHQN